jgi:hypothetical protein
VSAPSGPASSAERPASNAERPASSAERPASSAERPAWSLLALGGALLAAFALVLSTATLALSLLDPVPILMVFPFLLGPLAVVGGVLAGLGRRRARRAGGRLRGARLGGAGVLAAAATALGILPAATLLGLPGFRAFQLESRERQALHFLSQMRMGATAYWRRAGRRAFPPGDTGWTPEAPPTSRRYPLDSEVWRERPWTRLDFSPSVAHFHQLRYRALEGGRGFVVAARGDLDGDGVLATHTSTVRVGPDGRLVHEGPTRVPPEAR